MDALLKLLLENILMELPVSDDVKDALLGKRNILFKLLALIIEYEKGNWIEVNSLIENLELNEEFVSDCYLDVIQSLKRLENI